LIILRVKFHLKYISHIILNEERETIVYKFLDSRRWKDLTKINDEKNDDVAYLKSLKI
jgi:hypothetical protein